MARQKGSANLAATIEVLAGGALDARTTVPTEADLLVANNFPYPYVGLFTVVQATGDIWVLTNMDVTDIEHWHKVGSGGADNVVEGYYNETDGKFYEESTYTTEIVGADKTLYISLDTNLLYRFDGTDFVVLSAQGQTVQVDTMPTASADELGNIYQYVGTTTSTYTNGMFYKCITDGVTYSWQYIPTTKNETISITQAEFDALSQEEKDNGMSYYITDSSAFTGISVMGNRFDKANIYTADERMIGSYLGKPLYQKTLSGIISDSVDGNTRLSIGANCDYIQFVSGSVQRASNTYMVLPHSLRTTISDDSTVAYCRVFLSNNDNPDAPNCVTLNNSISNWVGSPFVVTIQYTKTTDGAVAIGTGNDYSTDEQIIGTWIDGKRLYQKTVAIDLSTFSAIDTTRQYVTLAELNIDTDMCYIAEGFHVTLTSSVKGINPIVEPVGTEAYSLIRVVISNLKVTIQGLTEGTSWLRSSLGNNGHMVVVTIQYTKTTD